MIWSQSSCFQEGFGVLEIISFLLIQGGGVSDWSLCTSAAILTRVGLGGEGLVKAVSNLTGEMVVELAHVAMSAASHHGESADLEVLVSPFVVLDESQLGEKGLVE